MIARLSEKVGWFANFVFFSLWQIAIKSAQDWVNVLASCMYFTGQESKELTIITIALRKM
jgi:hypothetical protein